MHLGQSLKEGNPDQTYLTYTSFMVSLRSFKSYLKKIKEMK